MNQFMHHFQVDPGNGDPLYIQVRRSLEQWIRSAKNGDRLPPEEKLAALFKVDRGTFRKALKPLVDAKVVVRKPRLGTIIADRSFVRKPSHPFNRMIYGESGAAICALNIALFEDRPIQQAMWNSIVNQFNDSHDTIRLVIEWLPHDINTLDRYKQYMSEARPDLVLLSLGFALQLKKENRLALLPKSLAGSLRSGAYHTSMIGVDYDRILSFIVPVHFTPWVVIWNKNLVQTDLDSRSPLTQLELLKWMIKYHDKLPGNAYLTASLWDLFIAGGVPVIGSSEQMARLFLKETFHRIEGLICCQDKLMKTPIKSNLSVEAFSSGQTAFYIGMFSQICSLLDSLPFKWKGNVLAPDSGRHLSTGCSCLAALRDGQYVQQAMAVLQAMAGQNVQNEIGRAHINAGFLKSANRSFCEYLGGCSMKSLDQAVDGLFFYETHPFNWGHFFYHELYPLFCDVIDKKISADLAIKHALTLLCERRIRQKSNYVFFNN